MNSTSKNSRMPVIFSGHGSPMIALENNGITQGMRAAGDAVLETYGRPKAILSISGHWYTRGSFVQSAEHPKQIYDMYGFPKELYEVRYPVTGSAPLTKEVLQLTGSDVTVNDEWGIDHGTWTVLVHMFPKADIPVVQLSVNGLLSAQESYHLGQKLTALREEGYLIFGSGNVVHNLGRVEWNNKGGSEQTVAFNDYIVDAVRRGDDQKVIHYEEGPSSSYAVPTPDHFLPLLYVLGAADGDHAEIFNNVCNLGSMAMTGFVFG